MTRELLWLTINGDSMEGVSVSNYYLLNTPSHGISDVEPLIASSAAFHPWSDFNHRNVGSLFIFFVIKKIKKEKFRSS